MSRLIGESSREQSACHRQSSISELCPLGHPKPRLQRWRVSLYDVPHGSIEPQRGRPRSESLPLPPVSGRSKAPYHQKGKP